MLDIQEISVLARERMERTGEAYRKARSQVLWSLLSEELRDCERSALQGRTRAGIGWFLGTFACRETVVDAFVNEERFTLKITDGELAQPLIRSPDAARMSLMVEERCDRIGRQQYPESEPRKLGVRYFYPPSRAEEDALATMAVTEDRLRALVRVGPPVGFKVRPFVHAFQEPGTSRITAAMRGRFEGRHFVVGVAGRDVALKPVDTGLDRAGPFVWIEKARIKLDGRGLGFVIEQDPNRLYMGAVRIAFRWGDDRGTDRRIDAATIAELFLTTDGFPGGSGHSPDRLAAMRDDRLRQNTSG
jgi:hypothetical protein